MGGLREGESPPGRALRRALAAGGGRAGAAGRAPLFVRERGRARPSARRCPHHAGAPRPAGAPRLTARLAAAPGARLAPGQPLRAAAGARQPLGRGGGAGGPAVPQLPGEIPRRAPGARAGPQGYAEGKRGAGGVYRGAGKV